MYYAVFLAFLCIAIFFCFIDYRGVISSKILYIIMFITMAYVTSNADMPAYILMYNVIHTIQDIGLTDPGFGLLMYIGKRVGIEYFVFIKWMTLIGLSFVAIVFRRKSHCPAIILAIYFILVFPVFTVQIRSFFAETILYILIVDMVEKKEISLKRFIVVLTFAVLFHAASFFFILMLLPIFVKNRKKLVLIVAIAMTVVPSSALILKYIPIPMIQQKIQFYFLTNREPIGSGILIYILLYIFIMMCINYLQKRADCTTWQERLKRLMDINIVGLVACVMIIVFSSNFYRMVRVIMVVDFLVLGNYYYASGKLTPRNRLILYFAFLVLFLGGELLTGTLLDICTNNSFLGPFLEM